MNDIPAVEYPTPAKRPANSRLECRDLEALFGISPPNWRADLADVVDMLDTAANSGEGR